MYSLFIPAQLGPVSKLPQVPKEPVADSKDTSDETDKNKTLELLGGDTLSKEPQINLNESNSAVFEKIATSGGESSDCGIRENEFFSECVKNNVDTMSDTDNSVKIEEHSFFTNGEGKSDKILTQSSDSSEIEEGLEKLSIKESCLGELKEDTELISEVTKNGSSHEDTEKSARGGTMGKDCAMLEDLSVDKDDVSGDCFKEEKQESVKLIGAETITCDSGVVVLGNEVKVLIRNESETVEHVDNILTSAANESCKVDNGITSLAVDSCNKVIDQASDGESSEQDNILGVYTQEDSNIMLQDSAESAKAAIETNDKHGTKDVDHSIQMVEDTDVHPSEKESDAEDIIGHSFLTEEDSVLEKELATERPDDKAIDDNKSKISNKDKKCDVRNVAKIDTASSSGSESDLEVESPESSPVVKKKRERPKSPENAEYEYVFTVESLTDGKVGYLFYPVWFYCNGLACNGKYSYR